MVADAKVVANCSVVAIGKCKIINFSFLVVCMSDFRHEDGEVYAHSGGGPEWEGYFQGRR